jgi:hypothetical protein
MGNPANILFPSDDVPMSVKQQKDWNLKFQKAMYMQSDRGLPHSIDSRRLRFMNLRNESEGLIDVDKFKNIVLNDANTALVDLSWNVGSVIPTFVKNMLGQFTNQKFRVDVRALNPESKTEYDKKKRELEANRINKQYAEQIKQLTGSEPEQQKEVFDSPEEEQLYMDMTWKQAECIAMENAIKYIHDANDEEYIMGKIYKDLIDLSIAAKRVYFDENYNIREKYVDPVNLITSFAKDDRFTDIKYAGEIIDITLDDLAVMTDFSEEQIKQIARQNAGVNNNLAWDNDWNNYHATTSTQRPYGGFKVRVLDAYYYSYDVLNYEEKPQKVGNGFFFNKAKKVSDRKTIHSKRVKNIYHSKWIVNTDFIFDYGLMENMTRDKLHGFYSTDTALPYVIYAPNIYDMENKSLVEKMIPYSNEIIILQLKAQQLVAQAHPAGMATDMYSALAAVAGLGEAGLTPRDLNLIYKQTGDYYFSSKDEDGNFINIPFKEIQESQLSSAPQLIALTHHNLQMLEKVTGVPISTIGSPDKEALVGIEKIKASNRSNSIRYIDDGYKNILGRSSKLVSLMIQDLLANGKEKEFSMAIGAEDTELLSISKKMQMTEYGLFVDVLPDALELAILDDQLTKAVQSERIKESDAMKIRRIAKTNVEMAERYIEIWEDKYVQEKMMMQEKAMQSQSMAQAQGALAVEQAKQQTLMTEYQLKERLMKAEYMMKMQMSDLDFKEDTRLKAQDIEGEKEIVELATQKAQESQGDSNKGEAIAGTFPKASGIRQPKIPQGGM